jgi:hypothetical protein
MTAFQAIKATFYMLLAKAREPIEQRELAPVSTGARHRPLGTAGPGKGQLKMTQMRRRKTDSPFQHESSMQRLWKAIIRRVSRAAP